MGARALPGGLIAAAVLVAGCGDAAAPRTAAAPPARTQDDRAVAPLCRPLTRTVLGRVRDTSLTELSGLASSPTRPGLLWAHEDSGSPPVLTALRADGRVVGRVRVTGAQEHDWEDIAALRTRARGAELLVLENGDAGGVVVYRVPEPAADAAATVPAAVLRLRFPDGSHDVEALLADPRRDEVVVVTKELLGGRAYTAPAGGPSRTLRLRRGPEVGLNLVTAGDVSGDGATVVLRSYDVLGVWTRRGDESLLRTLARDGCAAPVDLDLEGQGEAVALLDDGRAALTVPEGKRPPIRRYAPRSSS